MRQLIFLASILLSTTTLADHERGFFVGANIAYVSSKSLADSGELDQNKVELPALELVAGYKYNGWLGLDLRFGGGTTNRDFSSESAAISRVEYSLDSYQSFYYRPEITNSEAKLYFLIGYSEVDVESEGFTAESGGETSSGKSSFSESGTSYGLGAGWFVNDRVNVNVEYRELLDTDDDEFGVLTLGADFRF